MNYCTGACADIGIPRGQSEAPSKTELPEYDPACYLCPGNKRAQGDENPRYEKTFVFVNDYSAVKEEQEEYQPRVDSNGMSLSCAHLLLFGF